MADLSSHINSSAGGTQKQQQQQQQVPLHTGYEKVELAEDGVALVNRVKPRHRCCTGAWAVVCLTATAFVFGCLVSFAVTSLMLRAGVGHEASGGDGRGDGDGGWSDEAARSRWISASEMKANRARLRALVPNAQRLEQHVAALTSRQSRAGTSGGVFHASYVANELRRLGLSVFNRTYSVLLSNLDSGPSIGEVGIWLCRRAASQRADEADCSTKLRMDAPITEQEASPDALPSIVPYTKPLVGDFELITLEKLNSTVRRERNAEKLRKILSNKVILGDRSISRVINMTVLNMTAGMLRKLSSIESQPGVPVYPDGPGSPKSAIAMKATLKTKIKGDPSTPIYPSKPYAVRLDGPPPLNQPDHPTVPISMADVETLTEFARQDTDSEIRFLRINWPMQSSLMPIQDVCAEMPGWLEPDRALLVGGHRDAWHSGALDPHSGLASLLEVGRALAQLRRDTGWQPRRTLLLCSWDAEEWNLIGSAEWLDEEIRRANRRLVGYINTDTDIMGNWKVMVHAFRRWHGLLDDLFKEVPNPDQFSLDPSYHFYITPDAYSDYYVFWRNIGLPIVDLSYIRSNETRMVLYDLYHSRYDTLTLYRHTDPGGRAHLATVHNYLGIVYTLLDAPILPTNLTAYADEVIEMVGRLYSLARNVSLRLPGGQKTVNGTQWRALEAAFHAELGAAAAALRDFQTDRLDRANASSTLLEQRMLNDKVMEVQKAFVYRSTYPHQDVVNLLADQGSLRVLQRIFRMEMHDPLEMQVVGSSSNDDSDVKQKNLEKLVETCILSLASVPKLLSDSFAT